MPISRLLQCVSAAGLIALAGWLLIGTGPAPADSSRATEELIAVPPEVDFGEVPEGTHLHYFDLSNTDANSSIIVRHVIKNCACDDVVVPGRIGPSESVRVPVAWNVTGKSGVTWTDLVIVWSKTDTPENTYNLRCRLVANVNPDFEISPDSVTLYAGTAKDAAEIHLTPRRIADSQITNVGTIHPALEAKLVDDRTVQIRIKPGGEKLIQDDSAFLSVSTNSVNRPILTYTVFMRHGIVPTKIDEK